METLGRHKYARQLLRSQRDDERAESDDPEGLEDGPGPGPAARRRGVSAGHSSDDSEDTHAMPRRQAGPEEEEEEESEEDEDDDEEEEDEEEEPSLATEGAYDPAEYANLPVSTEIKDLFQYITRYSCQAPDLEHSLKPFIPDFIPAVGDIDAFLKVPRPDGVADKLGLLVLDEPSVKQSDPTVMSLWLSEESKQHTGTQLQKVTSVASPHNNPRQVDSWVESVGALQRSRPPASVQYGRPAPTIDSLLQEWPPELEQLLGRLQLPPARLRCSTAQYAQLVCCLLDIPVHSSRVQALHLLFSLYLEARQLQQLTHTHAQA